MKNITILTTIIAVIFFTSCTDKEEKEQELLQAYITDNNITTTPTTSGMYYIETESGAGNLAKAGDKVTVHYTGTFLDGEQFDSSIGGSPFDFTLGAAYVIKGWDEGIAYMKKGGKAKLIIPSDLAYGPNGRSTIPGYSTLLFDVELINIQPSK